MKFDLSFKNSGNVPITDAYIVDGPVPGPPFDVVRLVNMSASSSPASVMEVYDPNVSAYVTYNAGDSALLARATGIRVRITGPLPVGVTFRVSFNVLLRDGVPFDTKFTNCAQIGIAGVPSGAAACSPEVTVEGASAGASLQKLMSPANVLRPEPGLPAQKVTVGHKIQNSGNTPAPGEYAGNVYLKRLIFTDTDTDFFDAVDFAGNMRLNFPPGANRVQVDVCTDACPGTFHIGTVTGSTTPGLPSGVAAADVRGIRVTFTSSSGGYSILPGGNYPTSGSCPNATFCFDVTSRQFLRGGTIPIPANLENTSEGAGESALQPPGETFAIPPATDNIDVIDGEAQIKFTKGPQSRIGPGDTAPFDLTLENTGTTAIVNPVIVDPLPDDLVLEQNTPGGSPGKPFVITYPALPSGVTPPPLSDVTYSFTGGSHPDPNRGARVSWTFGTWNLPPGGKINIRIYASLAPGVLAGATITNPGGAHGSNSTITCAQGNVPAPSVDPPWGPGLYCLSSTTVTSLAGNAMNAAKWSAGDPALGFYNSATGQVVPTNDLTCPQYLFLGATYTRYPCAAQVAPGGTINFLIEMVNAGTNNLTKAVAVDGLPVLGDTGVLLSGDQRGTQWNNRPVMATPVQVVEGYGGLSTEYTNNPFPGASFCTQNLQPAPNDSCPAGAFAESFSAQATGFRTTMNFPVGSPLLPGQSVTLTWTMQAPPMLDTQLTMPIAWNSFAQKSTFSVGGEQPATEPQKAGVAMRFAPVTISKTVDGIPQGLILPAFTMGYRCTIADVEISAGTLDVASGATGTLPLQPAGADCAIWEITTNGGSTPNEGEQNAQHVTVPDPNTTPAGVNVTIDNRFDAGKLVVRKDVTGAAASLPIEGGGTVGDGTFSFNVSCAFPAGGALVPGFPTSFDLKSGEEKEFSATAPDPITLPAGSVCSVTELGNNSATTTVITADDAIPVEGDNVDLTVRPDFDDGSLVTVENQYDAGILKINKTLTGPAAGFAQGPFQFSVECTFDNRILVAIPATVTVPELYVDVTPLPVGAACAVYETDAGDSTPPLTQPVLIGNVIIPAAGAPAVEVSADNPFPAGYVSVSKVVDGPAAGAVANASFGLRVQCQRGSEAVLDKTVTVVAGQTIQFTDPLPIGAKCWASETANGGATSANIDHPDLANAVTVTEQVPNVGIVATNTFGGASLVVNKNVTGPAPDGQAFGFTVSCTMPVNSGSATPSYPVTLPASDASFTLLAGQSKTISVPQGARCTVREFETGGAIAVHYAGSGGSTDGVVDVNASAMVGVTNDFGRTICPVDVSALSGTKKLARNGTTVVVNSARTSKDCIITIKQVGKQPSGIKVQCTTKSGLRGDLQYCTTSISANRRVKVKTLGYAGVKVRVEITAVPRPGVNTYRAGSWARVWKVR
ncbi:MAG: DUF5979 domain-containing protein [Actinomycetes bacterium]